MQMEWKKKDGMEEEWWDGKKKVVWRRLPSRVDNHHVSLFSFLSPLFATLLFPLTSLLLLLTSSPFSYFSSFISFFLRTFLNNFSRKRSEEDGKLQTLNWFISAHIFAIKSHSRVGGTLLVMFPIHHHLDLTFFSEWKPGCHQLQRMVVIIVGPLPVVVREQN